MGRAEGDRDLPEEVARLSLANHAADAVDHPDRLDPALDEDEQRRQIALVHRVLARAEREVGRDATEPLEVRRFEVRKRRDLLELVRRQHPSDRHPGAGVGAERTARRLGLCFVPLATGARLLRGSMLRKGV